MNIADHNVQEHFWRGAFGREYTDRNSRDQDDWDHFYFDTYGVSKIAINEGAFASLSRASRILEVGCNTGMQLAGLQRMGFTNLYGIELQLYAAQRASDYVAGINIIQGSGFHLPFRDAAFDLVCTNGVLIHVAPEFLRRFMIEIVRSSKRFISGFEYYTDGPPQDLNYRGHEGVLWKADYCEMYCSSCSGLTPVYRKLYPHRRDASLVDSMFLLEKNA